MTQVNRLAKGGLIDRKKTLNFTFDGRPMQGYEGDTLASALLANNIHLVGRSFKYHRPRGIVAAGSEEPNGLVQLIGSDGRSDPNMRVTTTQLKAGLNAWSQNRWPSLNFDFGSISDRFAAILPAGFYYKTFMWPAWAWRVYEERIRAAAGLGHAPRAPDPDRYTHRHAHCDVLIVGAGPTGLIAALSAAKAGKRVILADEGQRVGGSLLDLNADERAIDDISGHLWAAARARELKAYSHVTILPRTVAFGVFDHQYVALLQSLTDHLADPPAQMPRQRLWRVRASEIILATGAIERPLVFDGNDRPGVMLAHAARAYANRYAVLPGKSAILFTNNDTAYQAAEDLAAAGAGILIADLRQEPGEAAARAEAQGLTVLRGHAVIATEGRKRVHTAYVAAWDGKSERPSSNSRPFAADIVLMSGGWNPNVALYAQARGATHFDDEIAAFRPSTVSDNITAIGAANGNFDMVASLSEAVRAGGGQLPVPKIARNPAYRIAPVWHGPSDKRQARAFVDFQNDVTSKDIELALREGYRSIEHVKRYTTTGMGTDQGKTSNVNALSIVAGMLDKAVPEVGATTFRAPYTPVTFGALVGHSRGDLFDVTRQTPTHGWAQANGAVFEDVGQWKRAWFFPKAGESMDDAVRRECVAVRTACGILDASTLGKIDIQGPDSAEFLNRVYTNAWLKLGIGKCRYGLMLGEDGMVFDDGVTARLGERHYHMTTTTGGAARVLAWLEEWLQTEWPELEVYCTSVTEQWATMAISGPKAREILALLTDIDLSPENLPHLSVKDAVIANVPGRIFRISFTGEISFEVNVPADYGLHVWQAIMKAGEPFGITPYGTEAMHVLRAEKGFIIVGQETDGTMTPNDLGMDWIISKKKPDFIGKRSLSRLDMMSPARKQLVGLLTSDPDELLEEGAQLVDTPLASLPIPMIGHVTSAYRSVTLERSIALAMIKAGRSRLGSTLYVSKEDGGFTTAEIVEPMFYDKEGSRMRG